MHQFPENDYKLHQRNAQIPILTHIYKHTHTAEKAFLYYVELITWYENTSTAGGITKLNYNWRNADFAKR